MVDEKRGKINKTLRLLNKQLEAVENEMNNQDFVNESVLNAAKTISVKKRNFSLFLACCRFQNITTAENSDIKTIFNNHERKRGIVIHDHLKNGR